MKLPAIAAVLAALLPLGSRAADYTDTATVISSTPIVQRVNNPRQECWQETVTPAPATQPERDYVGPIVGGVAGGVLGSQVGKGSGSVAATGAGAAAGTIIGDRVANPGSADHSLVGPVVGAVAGGLLGAQVGKGSGQKAATAAGAIAGAMVGERIGNPSTPQPAQPQTVQRCRQVDQWSEQVTGYSVVYRYQGRDFSATLPYDPGPTLRVGVSVSPLDAPAGAPASPSPPPANTPLQYQYTNPR